MTGANAAGAVVTLGGAALLISWGGWPVVIVLAVALIVPVLDILLNLGSGGRVVCRLNAAGDLVNIHAPALATVSEGTLPSPAEDRGQGLAA